MASKWKVGDLVVFNEAGSSNWVGGKGEVVELREGTPYPVTVRTLEVPQPIIDAVDHSSRFIGTDGNFRTENLLTYTEEAPSTQPQEVVETRTTSTTGAEKGVKPARFGLIPSEALTKVAEHYGKGAEKYAAHNWRKGYEWSKSYDALQRHANAFWQGEDNDPEFGTPHMAAVAFHALTLLTFMDEQQSFDDRFKQLEDAQ